MVAGRNVEDTPMPDRANQRIAYFNGRYVPEADVRVPYRDRSFLYGDGCFDMTRTFNGRPFTKWASAVGIARSRPGRAVAAVGRSRVFWPNIKRLRGWGPARR